MSGNTDFGDILILRKAWYVVVEAATWDELAEDLVSVDRERLVPVGGGNPVVVKDGKFYAIYQDLSKAPQELLSAPPAAGVDEDGEVVVGGADPSVPVPHGDHKPAYAAVPGDMYA